MKDKKNLYEIIADELEEVILKDAGRADRKLPSENLLAASFGVSRPVIREAVKILKERGIVSLHQGAPSVILEPGIETITNPVKRIVQMKNITPEQVYEMRMILEVTSIRLACRNATPDDLAELEALCEKMEKSEENSDERTSLDIAFHTKIAQTSGNPLLSIFIESISTLIYSTIKPSLLAERPNGHPHRKIVDAMKAGNEDECIALMRMHLLSSMRNYQSVIEGLIDGAGT